MDATPPPSPTPPGLLERFDPDPDALLVWLREHVDSAMLREIAEIDYGDVDKHIDAMQRLLVGETLSTPLGWSPNEPLSLGQHQSVPSPLLANRDAIRRAHIRRMFCCAGLLRWTDQTDVRAGGTETWPFEWQTVGLLLYAAINLKDAPAGALRQLIAWRLAQDSVAFIDRPFFVFALTLLDSGGVPDADLDRLNATLAWVGEEEHRVRESTAGERDWANQSRWLLGLQEQSLRDLDLDSGLHACWAFLARQFLNAGADRYADAQRQLVFDLARQFA